MINHITTRAVQCRGSLSRDGNVTTFPGKCKYIRNICLMSILFLTFTGSHIFNMCVRDKYLEAGIYVN